MFDLKEARRFRLVGQQPIEFGNNSHPRRVRLEVLAEDTAKLYVEEKGVKDKIFIGKFDGYDVVQFAVQGDWALTAKGGPVRVWTGEFDTLAVKIPEAVSFTTIMTRPRRSPEVEAMMMEMNKNMERRIAQVERDQSLKNAARDRIIARDRETIERFRREEAERATLAQSSDDDPEEDEPAET